MLQKERNSSFELLRIISMMLIVSFHYAYHGGFDFKAPLNIGLYFIQCLDMGGKLGVNLFVLISGYFLCKTKFNWKRLLKLEFEVIFYSVIIGLIFHFALPEKEGIKGLAKEFFPLHSGNYWFYSVYFALVLISPLLNKLIERIQRTTFRELLIAYGVIWIFVPIFQKINIGWFVFLYLCAAYIRFFPKDFKLRGRTFAFLGIISYFLIFIFILMCDLFSLKDLRFRDLFNLFLPQDSVLIFLSSIFLFIGFSKWNIGSNKIINLISSATFGVYLIHDNNLVRPFLWLDLFKNAKYQNSNFLILHALIVIALVYIFCTLIDLLRKYFIENPIFRVIEKFEFKFYKRNDKS